MLSSGGSVTQMAGRCVASRWIARQSTNVMHSSPHYLEMSVMPHSLARPHWRRWQAAAGLACLFTKRYAAARWIVALWLEG